MGVKKNWVTTWGMKTGEKEGVSSRKLEVEGADMTCAGQTSGEGRHTIL
jgi:hypothetical protein